ncbi:MFS general substrate transporter [Suillus spraguei]|nr:MFS general substrate transporter [Suillus spraguei]
MEPQPPALFSAPRILTLLGSILLSLSSGTNYIYSAYAPQLGVRLFLTHTQLNVIGLAGNVGIYISGPAWGRVVDSRGPRIPLISAFTCFLIGYLGMRYIYDNATGSSISFLHLFVLIACSFMTGLAGNASLAAAVNTTVKSFPETSRGIITGLVLSGVGLSAFFFATVTSIAFPGDISALLLVLGLGTAIPMLLGLAIVRQIPLPPPGIVLDRHEEYQPIPSGDAAPFISGNNSRTSLLDHTEHVHKVSNHSVPEPSTAVELASDRIVSRRSSIRSTNHTKPVHDGPNVYGKQLWLTPDFYLICIIMSLLGGSGIMYVNNVGSISQALYAKGNPNYDELEASQWQAAQVSTLSVCNFAGRILIGLIADLMRIRLRLPRAYCLSIVSTLFVISQLSAVSVNNVTHLWKATALLGLAQGSLFGIAPTIVIDWFGLSHLSENWGFVSLSPLVGGNIFSLMFGRNLDSHASNDDTETYSSLSLARRSGLPSDHQCSEGRDCYVSSLYVTATACLIALGLSVWAGIRNQRKTEEAKREVI